MIVRLVEPLGVVEKPGQLPGFECSTRGSCGCIRTPVRTGGMIEISSSSHILFFMNLCL